MNALINSAEEKNHSNDKIAKVVIPIYKKGFTTLEQISFNQIYTVLGHYPIVIIKPKSLDLSFLQTEYPSLSFESFDDKYFQGITGYNHLLLSDTLYKRFLDTHYILICQLDSYVFRDELLEFCNKEYDYIGAPWLKKPIYQNCIMTYLLNAKKRRYNKKDKPCRQNLYDKIGNGGFSLRKTSSFYEAAIKHRKRIDFYLSHPKVPLYNEDVFWAIEVPEFTYPSVEEAIRFAFDKYPKYCFKLNNNQLPFGCHGWYKRKWRSFWKKKIDFNIAIQE